MLLVTFSWLYILFLCLIYGHMVTVLLGSKGEENKNYVETPVLIIAGLMSLTAISALASLFVPVSMYFNIFVLLTGVSWITIRRNSFSQFIACLFTEVKNSKLLVKVLFIIAYIVAISFSATTSFYNDDGLYYKQTIQWIETYGVVPGLGNLHNKLGFNTNWHALSALFSWAFLGLGGMHDTNGFLYLVSIAFLLTGLNRTLSGSKDFSDVLRALLLLPVFLFVKLLFAPSSDLPAIFITWICFILLLDKRVKSKVNYLLAGLFAVYLITLKLSTLAVALIAGFILYDLFRERAFKELGNYLLLGVVIAVPWLARNVIITGYLLYPFEALDLFNFEWKMHPVAVRDEADWITSYAVMPGISPTELSKMSFMEWMPMWFGHLAFFDMGVVIATGISAMTLLLAGLFFYSKKGLSYISENRFHVLVFVTSLSGLFLWLYKAPDPRFSYGLTMFMIFWCVAIVFARLIEKDKNKVFPKLFSIAAAGSLFISLALGHMRYSVFNDPYILTPAPSSSSSMRVVLIDNVEVKMPRESKQCWDAPIPCSPVPDYRLRLRGQDISEGFVVRHDLPVKLPSEAFPE